MAIPRLFQRLLTWLLKVLIQSLRKLNLLPQRRLSPTAQQNTEADDTALCLQGDAIFILKKVSLLLGEVREANKSFQMKED